MGRLDQQTRAQKEATIRAAMDRILRGELPPGGKCDVKTLATASGITRAALYSTYLHLKEEFERRRDLLRDTGVIADPRRSDQAFEGAGRPAQEATGHPGTAER